MLNFVARAHSLYARFKRDESAQDGFEYLLVIAVVMVAIVGAIAAGGTGPVTAVWTAVQTRVTNAANP